MSSVGVECTSLEPAGGVAFLTGSGCITDDRDELLISLFDEFIAKRSGTGDCRSSEEGPNRDMMSSLLGLEGETTLELNDDEGRLCWSRGGGGKGGGRVPGRGEEPNMSVRVSSCVWRSTSSCALGMTSDKNSRSS